MFDVQNRIVFVAGHNGMLGSALVRRFSQEKCEILTADRAKLDLRDALAVRGFIGRHRPSIVLMAAGHVGGIAANIAAPAEMLRDNAQMAMAVIDGARLSDVERLVYFGSSCAYPRDSAQPISEQSLLTGPFEPTNEAYAIAKVLGIRMCDTYRTQFKRQFFSLMPCNLYGPGDNYDLVNSHVVAALIRRCHEAKVKGGSVKVWGTGKPKREFLHVDDVADATVTALQHWDGESIINVGAGFDQPISSFAQRVANAVEYRGDIEFDPSKPDGVERKLLDVSRITAMGWKPKVSLRDGLMASYQDFLAREAAGTL